MIKLDSGNVLLKPSQRRQLMAWLRRSLKLGERLGNFVLTISMWRSGRQFELRAERSGGGSGRVYTITYEAEDHSGNKTTRSVTVTVPKSQSSP